jgi:hypothetical protein
MNARRIHELMRGRFPAFDPTEHEWTNIAGTQGADVPLLASLVARHIPASEVLVEVHRKEGALLPRGEAADYIARHLGEGTIRIADREFKSVVVVALNGVAAGWQTAMPPPKSFTPEAVLRSYFHAKDENRPHLLEDVFASDAELVMRNQSTNIAFPAFARGRSAIAEVLVRNFALAYENVYSFYLQRPMPGVREFTCAWLVGMSERSSGDLRVGCGMYEWDFEPHAPHLARRLVVSIEAMQVLPAAESGPVFSWLRALDYPWSAPEVALAGIPASEPLHCVAQFLGRHVAVA